MLEPQNFLAQRPPFLLVDKILHYEKGYINTSKNIQEDDFYFKGHFPQYPLVPGVILIEIMVQSSGILYRLDYITDKKKKAKPGRIVKIENCTFYKEVVPPALLYIESWFVQKISKYAKYKVQIKDPNDALVAKCLIILFSSESSINS